MRAFAGGVSRFAQAFAFFPVGYLLGSFVGLAFGVGFGPDDYIAATWALLGLSFRYGTDD
jgi:hypothetical protein